MNVGLAATADDDAVATNGMAAVVEVTDEVVVDGPAVIALIKPETDTALPPVIIFGPVPISGVSVMTW